MTVLATVDVLFDLLLADGTPAAGARVAAKLTRFEKDGALVVPTRVEGTADAAGLCTLGLWPNARGVNGSQYQISATLGALSLFSGLITVPDAAPADQPVPAVLLIGSLAPAPAGDLTQALAAVAAARAELAAALLDINGLVTSSAVRFDQAQTLSGPQRSQARANIGLEPKGYVHTQSAASAVWVVAHGLGKYPAVGVQDSAGDDVWGSVVYDSLDQVTLTFSAAFSGKAYFN